MVSKSFPQLLEQLRLSKDTSEIIKTQKITINRYEETNEMLRQFNELSELRHKELIQKYSDHVRTLVAMKKDLDSCHKRISEKGQQWLIYMTTARNVKMKLKEQYPDSFAATADAIRELEERYAFEDQLKFDSTQDSVKSESSGNQPSSSIEMHDSNENKELLNEVSTMEGDLFINENDKKIAENIDEPIDVLQKVSSIESTASIISSPRSEGELFRNATDSPSDIIVNISLNSSPEHLLPTHHVS